MSCAKDDGFVPFVPFDPFGQGSLKQGDTVRLKDGIVASLDGRSGLLSVDIGGTGTVSFVHISAIEAVKRRPEPLKVGDIVNYPGWGETERAEIAAIRDGKAVFWPMESTTYSLAPRPVSELERVK